MGSVSTISLNNDRDVVEELHNKHKYFNSFAETCYAFDVKVSEGSSTWACTRVAALASNACWATRFCALFLSCFDFGSSSSLLLVIRFFDVNVALSRLAQLLFCQYPGANTERSPDSEPECS